VGRKKEALHEKELGNEAYKKKDFEAAITHYNRWGEGPRGWLGGQQYSSTAVQQHSRAAAWPSAAAECGGRAAQRPHACHATPCQPQCHPGPPAHRPPLPPHPVLPCTACLYRRAIELYDQDISFLSNRAAVHFEMGNYAACIDDCDKGERWPTSAYLFTD
jgi:hypothetical protein